MKRVRYTKFVGDLASEMDMEDMLQALSDYPARFRFPRSIRVVSRILITTLDDLREALRQLLESGDFFDERIRQAARSDGQLRANWTS